MYKAGALQKVIEEEERRKPKVSNEDKTIYIAGTMALALFTFLTLCGVFIAQALGVGVIAGVVTHVFFNEYYYKIKD